MYRWVKKTFDKFLLFELYMKDIKIGEILFQEGDNGISLEAFEIIKGMRGKGLTKLLAKKVKEVMKTQYKDRILFIECLPYDKSGLDKHTLLELYKRRFEGTMEIRPFLLNYMPD